ncbi:MAG: DUF354 domain-containing protein [Saprospiraceae bacterium]|nr:DUF354 domain-containing protein [Saprospiraceae bacterium]
MTILFDIGHPAHVHYFKDLIKSEKEKGNNVIVTARNKEVTFALLDYYNISFLKRGKGGKNLFTKLLYLFWADLLLLFYSKRYHVDIFISFASPYAAQIAWLLRKPHIALTDTENAPLGLLSFLPFSSVVITPDCFRKDLGNKHIRFNGYMETSYIRKIFNNEENSRIIDEPYVIIRFVSWNANHDIGQIGFHREDKIKLIKEISKLRKVYISSEADLPAELLSYRLNIHPAEMHQVLFHADLYIGEGATMASEAAMMGIPTIYVNSLWTGYIIDQEKNGLLFNLTEIDGIIKKSTELLSSDQIKSHLKERAVKVIESQIDLTGFLSWFINKYPESKLIMQDNPDFQFQFRKEIIPQ